MNHQHQLSLFSKQLLMPAIAGAFRKLNPKTQLKNPVMFVVYAGSILTTALAVQALTGEGEAPAGFILATCLWLWFTVLFANFAEALAEGRSKAPKARKYTDIIYEVKDQVAWVTINRPRVLNSFREQTLDEMIDRKSTRLNSSHT